MDINIRELIRYRDLIWMFVNRTFVTVYKQTIRGAGLVYSESPFHNNCLYVHLWRTGEDTHGRSSTNTFLLRRYYALGLLRLVSEQFCGYLDW